MVRPSIKPCLMGNVLENDRATLHEASGSDRPVFGIVYGCVRSPGTFSAHLLLTGRCRVLSK